MLVSAIVPAAGKGRRIKNKTEPKPFLSLGGEPLIIHTLRALSGSGKITEIILVVAEDFRERAQELLKGKVELPLEIVAGGDIRSYSVKNGLEALDASSEIVLIHDGVRPLVSREVISRSIDEAGAHGACISAVPVKDTIKEAGDDSFIRRTADRAGLWRAQTPQAFKRDIIVRAYQEASAEELKDATDSSMLVEKLGIKVKLIEGEESNIKITTDRDLELAEMMLCA